MPDALSIKLYPKLKNAALYGRLGYALPAFFVLRDRNYIVSIIQDGYVPKEVVADLERLCKSPLVLRTDARDLAPEKRQMLPRSDELRSSEAAIHWLLGSFRCAMKDLSTTEICLIGHHFIPAAASAWCQAFPNERRVRIEALWGIPEGMYYFAHDVYDVDTHNIDIAKGAAKDCEILAVRERYKDKFIAPNADGGWIVYHSAEGPDWRGSIHLKSWVKEIAWTSRRIAVDADNPVVVMWLIDIPAEQKLRRVMPWYHERWKPTQTSIKKAIPSQKRSTAKIIEISGAADWENLVSSVAAGARVERVLVNPNDSSIIRSRDFVEALGRHAKEHDYVVEVSGGLLTHFFYMLSTQGCNVECTDLFAIEEDEVEYNKIVRDKIPEDIASSGEQVSVIKLTGDALVSALKRKLLEEAFEAADAKTADQIVEELSDVQEVISALVRAVGATASEISNVQEHKREKRGGFDAGLMLKKTTLSSPLTRQSGFDVGTSADLVISRTEELPRSEGDFHLDRRVDAGGIAERQLTIQLPAYETVYAAGEHSFELDTPEGIQHEMFFNARIDRTGSSLRIRIRLTNAAIQTSFSFGRQTSD